MSNITSFSPVFDASAGIVGPSPTPGVVTFIPVDKIYCLNPDSAKVLAEILAEFSPSVEFKSPLGQFGGAFHEVGLVPFLKFPNGFEINAGLLANYWNHGWSFETAYNACKADLQTQLDNFKG
jgi:hypothetical protein